MEQDERPIIIGSKNIQQILYSILKRGLSVDEINLQFTEKHEGDASYILRILRKSAGWEQVERKQVETINLKCFYDDMEFQTWALEGTIDEGIARKVKEKKREIRRVKLCRHKDANPPKGCTEELRNTCPYYKRRYNNSILVTQVTIQKLPQIRD